MAQSRRMSLVEAVTNNVVAFVLSVVINQYLMPIFGFYVTLTQSVVIVLVYTFASIIRSYFLRRVFNKLSEAS